MEQNVIAAPLEPANVDVEAMTRKRARVEAAMRKFRIGAIVVTACTKLSSRIRCDLEVDGDFSEEPEQARSELLAVLSTRLSSARLDEQPSLEDSLVASGDEGLCMAYPEAAEEMIPLPRTANIGLLSNPNQDQYATTQRERSEPFEEAVGTMFTLPSEATGFLSVHSQGRIMTERENSEQYEQAEWDMITLATADNTPNQWHPTPQREESGQYEQHISPNAEEWPLHYLFEDAEEGHFRSFEDLFKDAEGSSPIGRVEGLVEDSLHAATTPILKDGDAIQSGINDQLLEQRGPSELESQRTLLRREPGQWKELVSNTNKEIAETIRKVDQASYRRKLQQMQSQVKENSKRLKSTIQKLQERLKDFLDDLKRTLSNGVSLSNIANAPTQQEELAQEQQGLIGKISQVVDNFSLNALILNMTRISEKLDGLVKPLEAIEFSMNALFQNCASAVCVTVESFLAKQGPNFMSVVDFKD